LTTSSASTTTRAASASRSVPLEWLADVITASPPKPRTVSAMRASSVATRTRSMLRARRARA
jgi:hypothetical protein